MSPANRHQPRRATSSESDYSITEFLRDFPDDAACLEHLQSYLDEYAWRYNRRFDPGSMFHALLAEAAK